MDDAEIVRLLKERGYTLGDSAVREDGVFLWQVNETFMFRRDAVDLASDACTLGDVIARNEGNVFPNAPSPAEFLSFVPGSRVPGIEESGRHSEAPDC